MSEGENTHVKTLVGNRVPPWGGVWKFYFFLQQKAVGRQRHTQEGKEKSTTNRRVISYLQKVLLRFLPLLPLLLFK